MLSAPRLFRTPHTKATNLMTIETAENPTDVKRLKTFKRCVEDMGVEPTRVYFRRGERDGYIFEAVVKTEREADILEERFNDDHEAKVSRVQCADGAYIVSRHTPPVYKDTWNE